MTSQGVDFHYDPFNPKSFEQIRQLTDMYEAYLLEEHARTDTLAAGFPVANFLQTLILWADDQAIGFCSVDHARCSVELIYIDPQYRGQGLARDLLAQLAATCPRPMELKAPLSPGGQALADSLGLGVAVSDKDHDLECVHRAINARCPHKRGGNPARPCPRCFRKGFKKVAAITVGTYVASRYAMAMAGVTSTPAPSDQRTPQHTT